MVNVLNQSLNVEDTINLREVFKILIESKKLIISTILIFTIASIIYSFSLKPSFKTSTKLEIGYLTQSNGDMKLVESVSNLISHLNILFIKNPDNKFNQNLLTSSIEKKIITLETSSSSAEKNENLLNEVIRHIDERHSNIAVLVTNRKKTEISQKIKKNESEITYLKEKIRVNLEDEISKLEFEILASKNELPIIDQEISQLEQVVIEDTNNLNSLKSSSRALERASNSPTLEQIISSYKSKIFQLTRERNNNISSIRVLSEKLNALKKKALKSDELFRLEQEQKTLENQLQLLMTQAQIKTLPIGNIITSTIKPKTQLMISLCIIFGFITGIFLVFINTFIKSYR
jgi:LPS O-antigen subunit length determinant protein (WzzB/FepE family)